MNNDIRVAKAMNGWIVAVSYDLYKSHKEFVAKDNKELLSILENICNDLDKKEKV